MIINIKPSNKINERLLRQELEAIQANAKIQINQSMNWNRFPYRDGLTCPDHITPPDDIDAPWTSPFYIEITNGEEDSEEDSEEDNRAAFEAAIQTHDPAMTDQEERLQAANQQRAQELLEALMLLPDEYLSQIKARFDALP